MTPKPTPAQLAAVRYADALSRGKFLPTPRRDVICRAAEAGLVEVELQYVHSGLTYRSRQRLEISHIKVTDAGRALLDNLDATE